MTLIYKMEDFVHLHVHTQYSILDGQASIARLVDKAMGDGMRGMAVTDHGNMMGIKEFFNYTRKKNAEAGTSFKPIFGCEMYVAPRLMTQMDKDKDAIRYHLIVLAKNEKGYHNLIKLVSHSWTEGFYSRPRTDRRELATYHEGLIVSSACLGGEVPQKLLKGDMEGAEEAVRWYKDVFGDDYYLELQRHEVTDPNQHANRETFQHQKEIEGALIDLARRHGVKLICTNDCHFVDEDDAEAHDRLICLSTNRDLDDPKRMLYSKQEWFKTREEMNKVFSDIPEAMSNTCEICDKVELYSIDHAPIMPNFAIPESFGTEKQYRERFTDQDLFEEFTRDEHGKETLSKEEAEKKVQKLGGCDKLYRLKLEADYLKHLTFIGAGKVYGKPIPPEVCERLNFELHVMKTMGFPGYFLIVQDYINAARHELNVYVGPGRGSAAGSAVAYCLGITKIDPIRYNLLFERFLNPDRISLPDIDVDFDDDGRGKVLSWVTQKYGEEKVAHIITYGTMATKLAIKDVARVEKLPLSTADALCKLIPFRLPNDENGRPRKLNLTNAIACIPKLHEAETSPNPRLRDTIAYAKKLEGNVRNTGVHACGVIICRDDVSDWVPISIAEDKETGEKLRCTQYEGSTIEETGLIKMDFLGLKTLSIIKECRQNILDSICLDIDTDNLDLNDPATYKLYCDGRTIGTFQFESPGMQKYLRDLQPSTFEDLIAMNALYRPGPMDYIPDFILRKQGRKPVEYDIPCMENYLKDTYGITVYQEQVMLLSRQLANFTRGESDTLRKAMGKKQIEKLNHLYPKFIEGGKKNGHDTTKLEKIWNDWKKFASYAFNKSHATCYSWVAYQTAYLKANFPAQYMAAVMSRSLNNITDITKLMSECKAMGINVLGPDLNESRKKFSVDTQGNIRFGLAAIKGMGESSVETIIKERNTNGKYTSIFNFMDRIPTTAVKRNTLESLALSGALDCFNNIKREQYFAQNNKGETFIDSLLHYATRYHNDKASMQHTLFDNLDTIEIATPTPPQAKPWSTNERLKKEHDIVGFYLSAHPLDDYAIILKDLCNTHTSELSNLQNLKEKECTFGGIVTDVKKGTTKAGRTYGIVTLEDYTGAGEIALFGKEWAQWSALMDTGNALFIKAKCQPRQWDPNSLALTIEQVEFLADASKKLLTSLTITIPLDTIDDNLALALINFTQQHPGNTSLNLKIEAPAQNIYLTTKAKSKGLTVNKDLLTFIQAHPTLSYKIN